MLYCSVPLGLRLGNIRFLRSLYFLYFNSQINTVIVMKDTNMTEIVDADTADSFLYQAPRLKIDVGEFAKVEGKAKTWENFNCDIQGKENQKESRLPIKILEGAEKGSTRTLRTRSDTLIFDSYSLAGKEDMRGVQFWIQKVERQSPRGSIYRMYVVTKEKPQTNSAEDPKK